MRLVDADALLSELEKYNDLSAREKNEYLFGLQQRLETCIDVVEDAPTVDAVEVVRCKDCKHYRPYAGVADGYCHMAEWYKRYQYENDFCSRGERKDGEHETD